MSEEQKEKEAEEKKEVKISLEWTEEYLREDAELQIKKLSQQGRISSAWSHQELVDFIVWLGLQKDVYPIRNTMQTPREFFLKLLRGLPGILG